MYKTSSKDVASWLARETGHVPEDEETTEGTYSSEEGIGLPNPKHEKLRRFFDGLNIEKGLTERRRADALSAIDETAEMNKALKGALPTPPAQEGF